MSKIITFTSSNQPYGWMGNMAGHINGKPLTIEYDNKTWKTTENLFQALRFKDLGIQGLIRKENGYNGKQVAKRFSNDMCIKPLSRQDIKNMILCVSLKIEQYPEIKKALIETEDKIIIEDVTQRIGGTGMFWGSSKLKQHWIGHNILGKIWMYLRDNIQGKQSELGCNEEEFVNIIFKNFTYSEHTDIVQCIKNEDGFYKNSNYRILEENEDFYYIENEKGDVIIFYKESYKDIDNEFYVFNSFFKII